MNRRLSEGFATKLRIQRKSCKLTQSRLAELTGVSTTYISMLENAESNVSLEIVYALSKALQCSVCQLLPEVDGYQVK